MKKKIKDLRCLDIDCKNCPFNNCHRLCGYTIEHRCVTFERIINDLLEEINSSKLILEQEIEVEEDDY